VRLNRRGSGTGLLWSRILPAAMLLVAAGAAVLGLGFHAPLTSPATLAQSPAFAKSNPLALTPYGLRPLMFEPNQGQAAPSVKFIARGSGYGLFLTGDEAVLALQGHDNSSAKRSVVRMRLASAKKDPELSGTDQLPGRSHYLIGGNPANWHRDVPQYARVRYAQVYPGIDLIYYGQQGQLEYDFEVAPGVDPHSIALYFEGSQGAQLEAGDLVLPTEDGSVRLQAPRVYQTENGTQQHVEGRFVLLAQHKVGFEVGPYDRTKTLVIDPVLTYSTYLGGTGLEFFPTIAVDSGFNMYVAGSTSSMDFPVTSSAYKKTLSGAANVFVAEFDPTGATLLFATFLGGTGTDKSIGIAVDAAGNSYVAGTTTSTDFPTSPTGFQTAAKAMGMHAFVSELDPTGANLKYSTYLSGSGTDKASGMTLDNKGFVYVIGTTNSADFPTAPSAGTLQPTLLGSNAFFVSKVDPTTSGTNSLPFSTYFGGGFPATGTVAGGAIAVDNNSAGSNIYITGGTSYIFTGTNAATDFPIKNAFQPCLDNPTVTTNCPTTPTAMDAFVAKINPGTGTGAQLLYSTYLGGSRDEVGYGIGLDASGNAYVTGSTNSADPPSVSGGIAAYQPCLNTPNGTAGSCPTSVTTTDAFIGKINNPVTGTGTTSTNVQLTYFTYLGGSGDDVGQAIAVDSIQGARIIGTTASSDLKTLNPVQAALAGTRDAFAARIDTLGTTSTTSQFVTYLGGSGTETGTGIAVDSNAITYLAGETTSGNFPTASPYQATPKGAQDTFVTKLGPNINLAVTVATPTSTSVNAGNQVSFVYAIKNNGDTTANVYFQDNLGTGSGTAPTTFVSATASGGTCPSAPTNGTVLCNLGILNGGATTNVTVNLTPTGRGTLSNSGTAIVGGSFSRTVSALPVTVNAFTLDPPSPLSRTVAAGNPASYQITLRPQLTFSASISLSCSAGLPGGTPAPTCTFSTTPVTLQGSSPSTVTLTISTAARTTTTAKLTPAGAPFYATWLPVTSLAFLGLGLGARVRRKGRRLGGLLFLALMTLVLLQPACGGHSASSTTTGTPAGTYTVTVTATSGTFSQTTPVTLVVQ
jgi:hypothetical protein